MEQIVLLLILWTIGLLGMPLAVFIYGKSMPLEDTNDSAHLRTITGWGMFLTGVWFLYGGFVLLAAIIER